MARSGRSEDPRLPKQLGQKSGRYPYTEKLIGEMASSRDLEDVRSHVIEQFSKNGTNRRTYNSLMSPASLLYVAETVGLDELAVRRAYEAAIAESNPSSACGAIRKIVTWDMVYALM